MTTKSKALLALSPGVRAHLQIYKSNAKTRKVPFKLTVSEAVTLFTKDCHYCGAKPERRTFSTKNKNPYVEVLSGIDRVDSALGYTSANTVSCCKACNRGKGALRLDAFLDMANRVAKKHPR